MMGATVATGGRHRSAVWRRRRAQPDRRWVAGPYNLVLVVLVVNILILKVRRSGKPRAALMLVAVALERKPIRGLCENELN
jgi:hypothetical protein